MVPLVSEKLQVVVEVEAEQSDNLCERAFAVEVRGLYPLALTTIARSRWLSGTVSSPEGSRVVPGNG